MGSEMFIRDSKKKNKPLSVPFMTVFKEHSKPLFLGTFVALATFVLFYLMTVFIASWSISELDITRDTFLENQILSVFFFTLLIPISALLADRYGRKVILMMASLMIVIFGFFFTPLLGASDANSILITLSIGMALMGFTYGPLGTILSELYPTSVRYTGASLSFNLAGIVGASFAPFIALWLSANYGIEFVGYYLSLAAAISLVSIFLSSKAKT